MMHWWWCGICERVAVSKQGDTCIRCAAAIEEICYPSDRVTGTWHRRTPWQAFWWGFTHPFGVKRDTPTP